MAADASVVIDFDVKTQQLESDKEQINKILSAIGENTGDKMDDEFKKSADNVVSEAKAVKKDVDNELKKPTATITPKVDDSEAQKGTQKVITSLRKLPKEQKVKLDADAKKAGIDDFTSLLKRVPKKLRTEILAQAQKDEVIDYESLLKRIPPKLLTDIQLNDNASDKLKAIRSEAENTETGFARLKTIVAGSFLGGAVLSGVTTVVDGLKDIAVEGANASDAMDKFRSTMQLGGFGEDEIKKTSDEVMEYANKTVYDLDDISNTTAQLAANGIKNYMGLTEAAGNLNAQAGGNAETFKSVAMMLTQTAGAGKLTTENWNQLADAIPGASGVLQKAMKDAGAYTGNFRDAMADGQITADEFADAITKLGQTDGAKKAAESTKTFEGAIGNLQAAVVDGMKNIIDAFGKDKFTGPINGLGNIVQDTFSKITRMIENNKKVIDALGGVFSGVFGAIGNTLSMFAMSFKANVAGVLNNKEVTQNVESFKKSFDRVMEAIKPIEQAIGGLLGVITGGAFSLAVDLVKGLAKGLGLTGDEADKAKGKLDFSGVARIFSTVSQSLNIVLGFIEPVVRALGEMAGVIAKSAFSTFADVLNDVGKALGAAFDKISPLIPALNETDKGMSAVSKHEGALKAVGVALGSIATAFTAIKAASVVISVVSSAASAFKLLSGAIDIVGASLLVFGDFLAANPIVAIVGVVIALGVAVYEAYKHFKPFRDWVNKTWDSLKSFGSGVAKVGKQIYHGIVDGISDVISWIKKNWKGLGLLLVNPIAGAIKLLYDNNKGFKKWADSVIDTIKNAWKSATKALVKVWESIVDGIVKVWKPLSKALSVTWDALKKVAEITFKAIGAVILAPIVLVSATIVAIWKAVHKPLEAAWKAISKTASSVWNSIKKTTEKVWNGIKDTVIDVALAIYKPVKKAWDKVVQVVTDLWNGLKKTASKIWNSIKDAVVDAAEAVYKPVHKAFTKVASWVSDKWDSIKKFTSDKWNNIKDTIGDMTDKAHSVAKRNTEALKSSVSEKWDAVKSVTGKAWGSVSDYVGEHSANAKNKASKNFNALKDTMSSILDSISQTWKRVWSGISDYFSGIWDDIKKNAKNGLNGVIDFLNGGVDGINNVVSFFGGSKKTVPRLPRLAKGGRMSKSTLALVNDEESPTYREAIFRRDGSIEVPKERNVLTHLEAGDAVMPAKQTAMLLGLPQYKGGFGDWLGKAASFVGNATGDIGEWLADKIDQLEDALKNPLELLMNLFKKEKNTASAIWHDIGEGAGKYIPESAVDWFKNKLSEFKKKFDESGGSNPPGEGVERWRSVIKHAAGMLHTDLKDWQINNMLKQIQTESGGNPNIVQTVWDVNMANGNPAQGLLQFIPETFKSWAVPGHTDIHNGLDQILAAIRRLNAMDTWNYIGHGHGWATGGHVYDKQIAWIAEDGDEFVINNRKPNADNLIANAIKQRAEINPNSFSAKIAHIIDGARTSGVNGYATMPSTSQPVVASNGGSNSAAIDYSGQIAEINRKLDAIADKQVKVDGRSFATAYEQYGARERSQRDNLGRRGLAVNVKF